MTVADAIAQWLSRKGVTHVFGIIGGGNVALWGAIARLAKTELVCCHHEQACVMAASYFARTRGVVGTALVTTGGGSANAVTGGIAGYMDSVPLVILSGNENAAHLKWGTRTLGVQGFDSTDLASHFTKYAMRIEGIHDWDAMLGLAFKCAAEPRMGPVWVDIPKDVQGIRV